MTSYLGMQLHQIWMITGMAAVTFGIRYIMFPLSGRVKFPKLFKKGLTYVPPVVLTAIIVPCVFMPSGDTLNLRLENPYLIGVITACTIGGIFKNILVTIIVSMVVFLMAQWCFAVL